LFLQSKGVLHTNCQFFFVILNFPLYNKVRTCMQLCSFWSQAKISENDEIQSINHISNECKVRKKSRISQLDGDFYFYYLGSHWFSFLIFFQGWIVQQKIELYVFVLNLVTFFIIQISHLWQEKKYTLLKWNKTAALFSFIYF
jgi:hypothetical protein